ncbi:MAG: hypothetical protein MRZ61_05080 [Oscillospiraceae bacterium]|nr:hypothetical protein [Oscillospiraceae bacterium]
MSIEKAKEYLASKGFDTSRVIEFDSSSATEEPVLIVAAGDTKINNSAFKAYFGVKAAMLTYDEVTEKIGHMVGGVCPFGIYRVDKCMQA